MSDKYPKLFKLWLKMTSLHYEVAESTAIVNFIY